MFFFFSNTNIYFNTKELIQRVNTIVKVILTTRQVELIDKHKLVKTI